MGELIRPVAARIKPEIGENTCSFPTTELGLGISLIYSGTGFERTVKVIENNLPVGIELNIDSSYPLTSSLFVIARTIFTRNGYQTALGRITSIESTANPPLDQYKTEHIKGVRSVDGTGTSISYQLVVGKKIGRLERRNECVFVDGWRKRSESPIWRLTIPLNIKNDPQLLIFAGG